MKNSIFKAKWKICLTVTAVAFMAAALMVSGPARAADNIGTGDIGGDSDEDGAFVLRISPSVLDDQTGE